MITEAPAEFRAALPQGGRLIGLDVGTSFGGIGSSREMMIASLAEPAMLMVVFTLSLLAGSTQLSSIAGFMQGSDVGLRVSLALALIALVMVAIAENGRIPVDNPATHLELTMVHEAMVLEYSGRHLALVEWASGMKLLLFLTLLAGFNALLHRYTGQQEDQQESMAFLMSAFLIALAAIALILMSQFNSLIKPVIIMTAMVITFSSRSETVRPISTADGAMGIVINKLATEVSFRDLLVQLAGHRGPRPAACPSGSSSGRTPAAAAGTHARRRARTAPPSAQW